MQIHNHFGTAFQRIINPLFVFGLFVFFLYLGFCFPLTGDDMTFSLKEYHTLEDLFQFSLNYGNGRYLGNLLVIPLVKSLFLRAGIKAICLTGCVLLLKNLSKANGLFGYVAAALLVIAMPVSVFRQAVAWTSGFQNYFPPVVFTLLCLFLLKYEYQASGIKRYLIIAAVGAFSLISQLYVEHNTVFNLLLGLALCIYAIRKCKRLLPVASVYTVFSVLGALLMAMHEKTEMVEGYRESYFTSFSAFFTGIADNYICVADTLRQGFLLWILLSFLCILLLKQNREAIPSKKIFHALYGILVFFPIYCTAELFILKEEYAVQNYLQLALRTVLPLVYVVAVMLVIAVCMKKSHMKKRIIVFFIAGFAAIAPLMVVFPIDSRCMLLSYVCFSFAALAMLSEITIQISIKKLSFSILAAIACCYVFVYTDIAVANHIREEYIAEKRSEHAALIVIPNLPHSEFLHFNFDTLTFKDYYYYYYEQPGDVEFIVTDWEKWIDYVEKEK